MKVDRPIYNKMCGDLRLSSREGAHSLGANKSLLKQSGNLKNTENNFGTNYEDVVNIVLRESNLFELDESKIDFRVLICASGLFWSE